MKYKETELITEIGKCEDCYFYISEGCVKDPFEDLPSCTDDFIEEVIYKLKPEENEKV